MRYTKKAPTEGPEYLRAVKRAAMVKAISPAADRSRTPHAILMWAMLLLVGFTAGSDPDCNKTIVVAFTSSPAVSHPSRQHALRSTRCSRSKSRNPTKASRATGAVAGRRFSRRFFSSSTSLAAESPWSCYWSRQREGHVGGGGSGGRRGGVGLDYMRLRMSAGTVEGGDVQNDEDGWGEEETRGEGSPENQG